MIKCRITAVIITKNECEKIEQTLRAVLKVCQEVLVIDSGSTDNTIEIVRSLGVDVIETEWFGYGATKNFANSHAKFDWILSIDADEVVDEELGKSIINLDLSNTDCVFHLKRYEYIFGKPLRFTEFKPSYKPRIFHRQKASWDNKKVHESLQYGKSFDNIYLNGRLNHFTNDSEHEFEMQTKHYAKLAAKEMLKSNKKASWIKKKFGPSFKFVKSYFFLGGIFDGKAGFKVSKMAAKSIKWRHLFYEEMVS